MKKRRAFEVFTLSFLDCICCGFGAVVLFYTIVQAQAGAQEILRIDQLTGEVTKLEEEVKEGTKGLVQLRNTLEKTDEDAASAQALSAVLASCDEEDRVSRRYVVRPARRCAAFFPGLGEGNAAPRMGLTFQLAASSLHPLV